MMNRKSELDNIIERILACSDGRYITEIYAQKESINDGELTGTVSLMVETEISFENTDLYDTINDLEEEKHSFRLYISVEPDFVERGYGITLWKKS